MKGLLLKDWYQVRTNMKTMYLTVAFVLAIWILSTSGDSSFAVNYSAVFLGMMPAYLLSYDHASGWTEYSFALPLSKELQVAEKYLVGLLCVPARHPSGPSRRPGQRPFRQTSACRASAPFLRQNGSTAAA